MNKVEQMKSRIERLLERTQLTTIKKQKYIKTKCEKMDNPSETCFLSHEAGAQSSLTSQPRMGGRGWWWWWWGRDWVTGDADWMEVDVQLVLLPFFCCHRKRKSNKEACVVCLGEGGFSVRQ